MQLLKERYVTVISQSKRIITLLNPLQFWTTTNITSWRSLIGTTSKHSESAWLVLFLRLTWLVTYPISRASRVWWSKRRSRTVWIRQILSRLSQPRKSLIPDKHYLSLLSTLLTYQLRYGHLKWLVNGHGCYLRSFSTKVTRKRRKTCQYRSFVTEQRPRSANLSQDSWTSSSFPSSKPSQTSCQKWSSSRSTPNKTRKIGQIRLRLKPKRGSICQIMVETRRLTEVTLKKSTNNSVTMKISLKFKG